MTPEQAEALRAEFPPELIGKLPKAGIHLDFVGHAAVTDRLLQVDPSWTWEPVAFDALGSPLIVRRGDESVLWARLTVCGVTTLGVGICKANAFELEKQLISDFLRNAAMRRGVALDLWSKEDLHVSPSASAAVVADLKLRMDSLPANTKSPCKRMFFECFGTPDDLKEKDVEAATAMVADFEKRESGSEPPAAPEPDSVPVSDVAPIPPTTGGAPETEGGAGVASTAPASPSTTQQYNELKTLLRGKGFKPGAAQVTRVNTWLEESGDEPVGNLGSLTEDQAGALIWDLSHNVTPPDHTESTKRDDA